MDVYVLFSVCLVAWVLEENLTPGLGLK